MAPVAPGPPRTHSAVVPFESRGLSEPSEVPMPVHASIQLQLDEFNASMDKYFKSRRTEAMVDPHVSAVKSSQIENVGVVTQAYKGGVVTLHLTMLRDDLAVLPPDCLSVLVRRGLLLGDEVGKLIIEVGGKKFSFDTKDVVMGGEGEFARYNPCLGFLKMPKVPGVTKLQAASPAVGRSCMVVKSTGFGEGTVGKGPLSRTLAMAGEPTVGVALQCAYTTNYASLGGDCGSAVYQGQGQLVGVHAGTGMEGGEQVNYFVGLLSN
jgi:hypothetical protein